MHNKTPNTIPYADNAQMMKIPKQSIKDHFIYTEVPMPLCADTIESMNATKQITGFFINATELSLADIKETYKQIRAKSDLKVLVYTNSAIKTNQLRETEMKNVNFISENGEIGVYERGQLPAQQCVFIDRIYLMSQDVMRWEIPAAVKKAVKELKGKTIFIGGEIFQTMAFGTAPTRADVGDVFNLIQDGIQNFILTDATSKAKDPVYAIQGVFDTISVFENEAKPSLL